MIVATRLNRRRVRRCRILWPATVEFGERSRLCTITDLSERGARLDLPGMIPIGGRIRLLCERFGELHGVVIWCKDAMAGLRFSLPADDVRRLLMPIVPGMGRRELAMPAAEFAARFTFGRKSRAA